MALYNRDLKALIGHAGVFMGSGLLLPARNGDLFRWSLEHGRLVLQPLTLISFGLYNEPRGPFLPSFRTMDAPGWRPAPRYWFRSSGRWH